jgi:hypothetical protein
MTGDRLARRYRQGVRLASRRAKADGLGIRLRVDVAALRKRSQSICLQSLHIMVAVGDPAAAEFHTQSIGFVLLDRRAAARILAQHVEEPFLRDAERELGVPGGVARTTFEPGDGAGAAPGSAAAFGWT